MREHRGDMGQTSRRVPGQDLSSDRCSRRVFDQLSTSWAELLRRATTAGTGARRGSRGTTTGTAAARAGRRLPVLLRDTPSCTRRRSRFADVPADAAINETLDIHTPTGPYEHPPVQLRVQRELGKSMAIDIRYVGNTNVSGWTSGN